MSNKQNEIYLEQQKEYFNEPEQESKLAHKAGLVAVGLNEDGEMEYLGDDEARNEFERLKAEKLEQSGTDLPF